MNERELSAFLKKSKIETSSDFTDNLMTNIEPSNETKNTVIWSFKQTFLIVKFMMMILSYALFHFSNLFVGIQIDKFRIPMFLIVSVVFLLCINHLIILYKGYQRKKEDLMY